MTREISFIATWRNSLCLVATALFLLLVFQSANALPPTDREIQMSETWFQAKFALEEKADAQSEESQVGVHVLECPYRVGLNVSKYGTIQIGDQKFPKAIAAHANSRLQIILPGPGKTFSATAGVENNPDMLSYGGSVRLSVQVDGQSLFQSDVLSGGKPGVDVNVPLDGATQLTLIAQDANDGIACDQAAWGNPTVELQDGTRVNLSDLSLFQETDHSNWLNEELPFSFEYAGVSSREFLSSWKKTVIVREPSENNADKRQKYTLLFDDPQGRLQLRCEITRYLDYPTFEWTLYFTNAAQKDDTSIIENIKAAELNVPGNSANQIVRHWVGGRCTADCYLLLKNELNESQRTCEIKTNGGRGSDDAWPYLNLESNRRGMLVAIGWPGQWSAKSTLLPNSTQVRFEAGQETGRFYLKPGETVRSPLIVVQYWERDNWQEAQNVWRQWMLQYNVPRPGGQLKTHLLAASSAYYFGCMALADEACQKHFVDRYLEEKIPLDYWWMDAGWYPCDGSWPNVGTWETDATRFPNGLRAVTDYARTKGMQNIVWFEPERVSPNSQLTEKHPDWVLGGEKGGLLDLSNPEVVQWLIEKFDAFLNEEGIELYRQDFNIAPLSYWKEKDEPDRQGITEIHHVEGYLAYWDELLRRNPNRMIDSCASGGRRNDLETMRRSVPLLRSDFVHNPISEQTQTEGISLWVPLYGASAMVLKDYDLRSHFMPYTVFDLDLRNKELDYETLRKNIAILQEHFYPLFTEDFYLLLDPSLDPGLWAAWQYHSQQKNCGVIQSFRRKASPYSELTVRLFGLEEEATYRLTNVDTKEEKVLTGKELLQQGFPLRQERETAAIWSYEEIDAEK